MARTIESIQQGIFDRIASDERLSELNSVSKVAVYRLFAFAVAFAIWLLETILDNHKTEIDTALYEQKSGTPRWYRNMALAYQFGFDLKPDDDVFDNTGYTDEEIEASKIIKFCSVRESQESNRLTFKIAGLSGDEFIQLTETQLEGFSEYVKEYRYAGVKVNIVNKPADKLLFNMVVYRDVLVIDATGTSILNGNKPVEDAIDTYLKIAYKSKFDGVLILNDLIAYLRTIPGVLNVNILVAKSSHYDTATSAFTDYMPINVETVPESGYFKVENYDGVSYVV